MLPEGRQGVFITLKQGDREEYVRSEMVMALDFPHGRPGINVGGVNVFNGEHAPKQEASKVPAGDETQLEQSGRKGG